jgi:glycosyltransferase involved in cell wall biosynthesis
MKLAILGPISWRTPPRQYGAWETVVSNLAEGLVARGYNVTLFAPSDSVTSAQLRAVVPRPYSEDESLDPKVWEYLHIANAMEQAHEFDLLHNSYDFMPLTYSRLVSTPMITTVHGFSLDQFRLAYRTYRDTYFVSISNADRDPYLPYVSTVYNGIRLDAFTYNDVADEYFAFVGRIHPDKGVHLAIDLAKASGRPLMIAGIIQDQEYFDTLIRPRLEGRIEFVGPVGPVERDQLLRNAAASLHLTTIPERFGLAMAESMACGTPVIGLDRGSVREVVDDGVTGFVCGDMESARGAVGRIQDIRRKACRERVERLFSVDAMVDGYVDAYRQILDDRVHPMERGRR